MATIHDRMESDMCRICLKCGANRRLFGSESTPISRMMIDILSLDIKPEDGLPSKICKKCFIRLTSAYKLKCLAEKSYSILLNLKKQIKNEDSNNADERKLDVKNEFDGYDDLDENVKYENESNELKSKENEILNNGEYEIKEEICFNESDSDTPLKSKNESKEKEPRLKICDLCGKQVAKLKEHLKLHDSNRKRISCTFCPRSFTTFGARKKHVSVHHLGLLYYCEICKKHYKRGYEHRRRIHSDLPTPYECLLCKRKFHTNSLLKAHIASHTKERPFPCSVCGKSFRTKSSSVYHRRRVHEGEKEIICQFCSKAFFSAEHLKIHLRIHTKEKNYKCKDCGKCFSTSSGVRSHERRHTGIKNVQCSLCDMAFVNNGALKTHMVSHTKEKKYECKYCGVRFGRSDHRNRHQKSAHEKAVEVNPYIGAAILTNT